MTEPVSLRLEWIPRRFAVCRFDGDHAVPAWTRGPGHLLSLTRTDRELSITIDEGLVPETVDAERGWVALRVAGTLAFSMTGVLARLTGALAEARVPVFVISTFETDILLVKEVMAGSAAKALALQAQVDPRP